MATTDEELNQIERDVRTLKIEYEQFFGGGRQRPPTDTQWRVETLLRRYNERIAELTYGQRFRLNNLVQTYAKYQEMWRKKTVLKETGMQQHHFGAAAKAIEAERARKAAEAAAASAQPSAPPGARGRKKAPAEDSYALSISDPAREPEKVRELYDKLLEARAGTGERAASGSLSDFERFLRQKARELQDQGGREVEYTVSVENGRVKLKARVSA